VEVRAVDPSVTWPPRQAILRPHETADGMVLVPGALHLAAFAEDGTLVGTGSVGPEPHPATPRAGDWRIRGMATSVAGRGVGAGGMVLLALLTHVREAGGLRAWCNARTPARGFYARYGFVAEGAVFDLPPIGPHVVMARAIDAAASLELK
jgi:predicted GNAT family N-acyltransferase